eukprot:m.1143600 g.1143600  ORF g.1143600 m.1143600 type:complete len:83 (-) comp24458_c1_seq6:135-383(-)
MALTWILAETYRADVGVSFGVKHDYTDTKLPITSNTHLFLRKLCSEIRCQCVVLKEVPVSALKRIGCVPLKYECSLDWVLEC